MQLLEGPSAASGLALPECQPLVFLFLPHGQGDQTCHQMDGCDGTGRDVFDCFSGCNEAMCRPLLICFSV